MKNYKYALKVEFKLGGAGKFKTFATLKTAEKHFKEAVFNAGENTEIISLLESTKGLFEDFKILKQENF